MGKRKTRVLIIGGGFGGVKTALVLAKSSQFEVKLLSDKPDFCYYPTLYHTATGGKRAQSNIPLHQLLANARVKLLKGEAKQLDRKKKTISTATGETIPFDTLVVALGSIPNYFGIKGMQEYSYTISTPDAAREFKNHLHEQLDKNGKPDLNYVVVGGGPTGIELAGALSAYVRKIMIAHNIQEQPIHVDLVEAASSLVPRMTKRMQDKIARRLRKLGVTLYLEHMVQGAAAGHLTINGKPIQSHTIVWTAGMTINPFFQANAFKLTDRGKIIVDDYLQAEQDIFVLGDNAATQYSGMAQTALYDALFVAGNLLRAAEGRLMKRYTPKEPIYVIPVGHRWAAVQWGKVQLYGLIGWVLRLAADFIAFKDYQPWWRAGKQWMTEFSSEEDCPACSARQA